jgi:hypothetical protein
MVRTKEKTVWILGAGFSQPLGGPLLKDLFRQQRIADLQAEFPIDRYPGLASEMLWVQALYNCGNSEEHHWADPEEFLHYLDEDGESKRAIVEFTCKRMQLRYGKESLSQTTSSDGERTRTISRLMKDPGQVARRALAAECHRFLMTKADIGVEEMWIPYIDWVSKLDPAMDTILTFNYDLVLDMCAGSKLGIRLPGAGGPEVVSVVGYAVPVVKLHGSVDWAKHSADGKTTIHKVESGQVLKDDHEIAIAAPGRSKATSTQRDFPSLWAFARENLAKADRIVFLGYSFPKTDAFARKTIIEAIARNESKAPIRIIDVVLGPEIGHASVQRVLAMLEGARGRRMVQRAGSRAPTATDPIFIRPHRMWVEDFISSFTAHFPVGNE